MQNSQPIEPIDTSQHDPERFSKPCEDCCVYPRDGSSGISEIVRPARNQRHRKRLKPEVTAPKALAKELMRMTSVIVVCSSVVVALLLVVLVQQVRQRRALQKLLHHLLRRKREDLNE